MIGFKLNHEIKWAPFGPDCFTDTVALACLPKQSGRSPKVVALFSATNFSSYIIELRQLHDTIQIKWNLQVLTMI